MRARVIPALCLLDGALVKTKKFKSPAYIGDPVNTVRIFNELEIDEICLLGIRATLQKKDPDYTLLKSIAGECFMPVSYGGGIDSPDKAKLVFQCGVEKIIIGTAALQNPAFIKQLSKQYGSQAVVAAIDIKKTILGSNKVFTHSGTINTGKNAVAWAVEMEGQGAGEILLTSITNEGTWNGYNKEMIQEVSEAVSIPVIAHGGAGSVTNIGEALKSGASAVAAGSLFIYQKRDSGILINFPKEGLEQVWQRQ